MKKIFFLLVVWAFSMLSFAQSSPIYVVFTDSNNDVAGIREWTQRTYFPQLYNSNPRVYTIMNRSMNYFFRFHRLDKVGQPADPILTVSSIPTTNVIDWDVIGPTLTREQAEAKIAEILTHSPIYFINRERRTSSTPYYMVPVKPMRSNY